MGRNGTVCDPAITMCTCVPTPIWVKQHYRNQIAKPIRDFTCNPYGRTDLIWGASKFSGLGKQFCVAAIPQENVLLVLRDVEGCEMNSGSFVSVASFFMAAFVLAIPAGAHADHERDRRSGALLPGGQCRAQVSWNSIAPARRRSRRWRSSSTGVCGRSRSTSTGSPGSIPWATAWITLKTFMSFVNFDRDTVETAVQWGKELEKTLTVPPNPHERAAECPGLWRLLPVRQFRRN